MFVLLGHVPINPHSLCVHVLMRDAKGKKKGHTNNKAKQHNTTPKAVTFPKENELTNVLSTYVLSHLPRVGLETTTLYTLDRVLYH